CIDILHDHNGVVYYKAYGQYQCQHGEHVDGEPGNKHDKKGACKGDGNHDDRYDRSPPVAQEQENDNDNQDKCANDGLLDFIDGSAYVFGYVEPDRCGDVFGQIPDHIAEPAVEFFRDGDVIGPRLRNKH